MTRYLQFAILFSAAIYTWSVGFDGPNKAQAAKPKGRVNLVIAAEKGAPIDSYHTWAKDLGKAGVRNVRVRAARSSDEVGIKTRGSDQMPYYDVLGLINPSGDLTLPGARFRRGDARSVAAWVNDLAKNGPPESREIRGVFGLTKTQFDRVMKDLGSPVVVPTLHETRAVAVDTIAARLQVPLSIEPRLKATLAQDTVADELSGFTSGTALAYILRPLELGFLPVERDGGGMQYVVVSLGADTKRDSGKDEDVQQWPVGWSPSGSKRDVMPSLLRFHNVSIQNVSLGEVIDAVAEKLKAPILLDHAALARHRVDLAKTDITLPAKRTTYGLVLRSALSKAKLKYDLRVDENGKPFLWITTVQAAFAPKR